MCTNDTATVVATPSWADMNSDLDAFFLAKRRVSVEGYRWVGWCGPL